jgi:hypothetical protein
MRFQMVKNIKAIAPIAICLLIGTTVLSQSRADTAGPPPPNPECCDPPPDLGLPIDSGLTFLLILGLAYGVFIAIHRIKAKNIFQ